MLNFSHYTLALFLVCAITLQNVSWVYSNEMNVQYRHSFSELPINFSQEVTSLSRLHVQETDLGYDVPGLIRYQQILNNGRKTFAEVSGILDEDDPLEDFTGYLQDPVNWDPTQFIDRRFLYDANIGFQQRGHLLGGTHTVRVGLEAHAEEAHIHYVSPTNYRSLEAAGHSNLIDIGYAPYLTLHSTPVDWITLHGDARIRFLHFDTQNVCRTTCSVQPNSLEDRVIPSVRGNFIFHPWQSTAIFMNVGTGYHSFRDREPIGSTVIEQLTQVTSYEVGMRIRPHDAMEISASIWQVDLGSDRAFLEDGEEVQVTGSSRRQGIQLMTTLSMPKNILVSGNLTLAQATHRRAGSQIPLTPTLTVEASVNKNWGKGWESTFHTRHIGRRTDHENPNITLRPLTTFDFMTDYHLDQTSQHGQISWSFGILNLTNTTAPFTQFFFDSQHGGEQAQVFTLNYFPGQPRMVVSGVTWEF